jgi:hypothetical protein
LANPLVGVHLVPILPFDWAIASSMSLMMMVLDVDRLSRALSDDLPTPMAAVEATTLRPEEPAAAARLGSKT